MRIAIAGGTGTVGRHIVDAVAERGHEPIVLSRARGIDLEKGIGITAALEGVDTVIDAYGPTTNSAAQSIRLFTAVTRNLLGAERSAGVRHHVALSIVGAARIDEGYYKGKRAQEDLIMNGDIPWTVLRTTQFHEFAQQMVQRMSIGPTVTVPVMVARPVAASEVGDLLAELASGAPIGLAVDLSGPHEERMPDMVRRYLSAMGRTALVVPVPLPGAWGKSLRDGSLLPGPDAKRGAITYNDWLREVAATGPSRGGTRSP